MGAERGEYKVGRSLAATSRPVGFAVVAAAYLAAGLAAWGVASAVRGQHPLAVTFWADLVATAMVFAVAMAAGNSSIYDPYWSVAPAVIVVAWVTVTGGVPARRAFVVLLVLVWAVRLTANWALSWRGLGHEDWRYVRIREQTRGRLPWWLVSLTGIQLLPTLVVFAGLLAVWPAVTGAAPLGPLDAAAALVTAAAIAVEALADRQLRRFAGDPAHRAQVADRGLWRYSRHPNYLGEIGFWWGMWLFGLAASPSWWWTVAGPIAMVLLFAFVSVPMMDRRSLERRPAYAEHMRRVPALLPSPRPPPGLIIATLSGGAAHARRRLGREVGIPAGGAAHARRCPGREVGVPPVPHDQPLGRPGHLRWHSSDTAWSAPAVTVTLASRQAPLTPRTDSW